MGNCGIADKLKSNLDLCLRRPLQTKTRLDHLRNQPWENLYAPLNYLAGTLLPRRNLFISVLDMANELHYYDTYEPEKD